MASGDVPLRTDLGTFVSLWSRLSLRDSDSDSVFLCQLKYDWPVDPVVQNPHFGRRRWPEYGKLSATSLCRRSFDANCKEEKEKRERKREAPNRIYSSIFSAVSVILVAWTGCSPRPFLS